MKILLVNHYAVTPSSPGGTRHYDFGREWVRAGHHVTIVAAAVHHLKQSTTTIPSGKDYVLSDHDGITFCWVRTPAYKGNGIGRLRNMLAFTLNTLEVRDVLSKPDIVVGSTVHPFAALAAWWLARQWQVPFVLEVRDLWPRTLVEIGAMPRFHPLVLVLAGLERFLYSRAERIVTLLPGSQDHIIRTGGSPERIVYIPNGVVPGPEPVPPADSGRDFFTFVYAGAHGVPNNLEVLLEAAELLQDQGQNQIRFVLVGDGNEKTRLQEMAHRKGLRNVEFRPAMPKRMVRGILEQADALVLLFRDSPLYKYGISPNKLFDYMAAGRPLLVAANIQHPALELGAAILVKPDDPQALADGALKLAQLSISDRERMGQTARTFVVAHHNVSVLARRFADLLKSCCN